MSEFVNTQRPFAIAVTAGERYRWCACGRSQTQPFCDDSHGPDDRPPIEWIAPTSRIVWFCGCKRADGPLCDGSHKQI
jgi:CDGSH iron-sulfur domain-containing protein 3